MEVFIYSKISGGSIAIGCWNSGQCQSRRSETRIRVFLCRPHSVTLWPCFHGSSSAAPKPEWFGISFLLTVTGVRVIFAMKHCEKKLWPH